MNKLSLFVSTLVSLALALSVCASQLKEYGPIKDGDNLWAIAKLLRPDNSISVGHMMRMLFKYNPQAFINKDLNRLKTGAIIRVPNHIATTTDTLEKQPRAAQPAESNTEVTLQKKAQSQRSMNAQPSVDKLPENNQKLLGKMENSTDLKREIDRLRQENSAKENEISSLRSELLALRQAGFKMKPQGTERLSIPTSVSDRSAQVTNEDPANHPVIAEPLAEASPKQIALDSTKHTGIDSNFIVLTGLGLGVSVMMGIVGIMWRQGTAATKLLGKSGQVTDTLAPRMPTAPDNQTKTNLEESTEILLTTADAHLSSENYKLAETLLQQALAKDPSRDDIKLKLLQVYHKQKDQQIPGEYGADPTDVPKVPNATSGSLRTANQASETIDDLQTSHLEKSQRPYDTFMHTLQRAEAEINPGLTDAEHIDKVETKLELAHAYVDMGDLNRAQSILNEVMLEGTQAQQAHASTLIMQYKKRLLNIG